MAVDLNKPLFQATLGDLQELLLELVSDQALMNQQENHVEKAIPDKKFVYGLAGIQELFGCSHSTAYRLKKSGILDPAISQIGHILVVDAPYALDLVRLNPRIHKKVVHHRTQNK